MNRRLSRRLRRLILGSLITASSLGASQATAESPASDALLPSTADSAPVESTARHGKVAAVPAGWTHDSIPRFTRTSARFDESLERFDRPMVEAADTASASVGAALWRWIESFGFALPRDKHAAPEVGSRTPPDWDSRDDDTFDVVTLDDLLRDELESLPRNDDSNESQRVASPETKPEPEPERIARADQAEPELVNAAKARPLQASRRPVEECPAIGGSPMIVTLAEASADWSEEYRPYDLDGEQGVALESGIAGPSEIELGENDESPLELAADDSGRLTSAFDVGCEIPVRVPSFKHSINWSPRGHATLAGDPLAVVPPIAPGIPTQQMSCSSRGLISPSQGESEGNLTSNEDLRSTGSLKVEAEAAPSADTQTETQREAAEQSLHHLISQLAEHSPTWNRWAEGFHPRQWGPRLLEGAQRGEQALQVAAGVIAQHWPAAAPQPAKLPAGPRLPAGSRLLARAGAVPAADVPAADTTELAAAVQQLKQWWTAAETLRHRWVRLATGPGGDATVR